jgi:hypothetical protein
MTTHNVTFINDDDWSPTVAFSGSIVGRRFKVFGPEIGGQVTLDGTLAIKIPRPQPLAPEAGQISFQGHLSAGVKAPAAAFKDFSHYPYAGVDPAMAWIGINSGTLMSAAAGSYNRAYTAFTGPVDYPVSGGGYAWKRAAYASVGFKFASMSVNKHQILDAVQFEALPVGSTGPSAYQNAREIQAIIKPTRLNYASNPNFESALTGYGPTGQATHALDSYCWQGTQALKVTVPTTATADSGLSFQVSGLIPGRTYTMSARVAIAQGCGDITPWSGTGSVQTDAVKWTKAANERSQVHHDPGHGQHLLGRRRPGRGGRCRPRLLRRLDGLGLPVGAGRQPQPGPLVLLRELRRAQLPHPHAARRECSSGNHFCRAPICRTAHPVIANP